MEQQLIDPDDELDDIGEVDVDRALMWNALVLGACFAVVLLVADASWPAHMGEEQGLLIERLRALL